VKPGDLMMTVRELRTPAYTVTPYLSGFWHHPGPEDGDCCVPGDGCFIDGGTIVLVLAGPTDTPNLKKPGCHREWLVFDSRQQRCGWVAAHSLTVLG
jgi:hypothetical protein